MVSVSKRFSVAALACGLLAIASECTAQSFPSRPIRLVVPYGAGGSPDVTARVIGQRLGENVGQPVLVDNRPGANGIVAAEIVMNAPANGYTLFVADVNQLTINPSLYPTLPYDALRDFAPVIAATMSPIFLAVNAALPIRSVRDLIDYAKAHPGVNYGSPGIATAHTLGMEQIKLVAQVDMTHIPYKGVAQSVPALITGDVVATFAALPSLAPHVKAGKIRLIAVGTAKRTPLMPEVPTIVESGLPGVVVRSGVGILAPAGTPADVITRLNSEIARVLAAPDIVQRLAAIGVDTTGSTPQQFAESIRADLRNYAKLVKEVRLRID